MTFLIDTTVSVRNLLQAMLLYFISTTGLTKLDTTKQRWVAFLGSQSCGVWSHIQAWEYPGMAATYHVFSSSHLLWDPAIHFPGTRSLWMFAIPSGRDFPQSELAALCFTLTPKRADVLNGTFPSFSMELYIFTLYVFLVNLVANLEQEKLNHLELKANQ